MARKRIVLTKDNVLMMIHVCLLEREDALSCSTQSSGSALELAMRFHEAYERLAPSFGYETKAETQEFDPQTPNGRLMIAVCREIIEQGRKTETQTGER